MSDHTTEARSPCRWCGGDTLLATLAQYGARCFRCYEASCREAQPKPRIAPDKQRYGAKAWAWALKAREEAGERLTLAQQSAWRDALRPELAPRYDDEPAPSTAAEVAP